MNSIFNASSTPASMEVSPSRNANSEECKAQLRDLERQKMDLKNQITELKNNTNLEEEQKQKQIEKLEDMVKALEEQIAAVRKQQNAAPTETEPANETQAIDFSNLPNHQPDEFIKNDTLSHSPTGRYEIFQDKEGKIQFTWDKPDEEENE